eukprot:scaffold32802_cov90-Isochrysis_galbana.AAC.1
MPVYESAGPVVSPAPLPVLPPPPAPEYMAVYESAAKLLRRPLLPPPLLFVQAPLAMSSWEIPEGEPSGGNGATRPEMK